MRDRKLIPKTTAARKLKVTLDVSLHVDGFLDNQQEQAYDNWQSSKTCKNFKQF